MTDDFSGTISVAWVEIGTRADELYVVPKGDQTYLLLSLADLTTELMKQEVDDWNGQQIYEYLRDVTPDDSAYADSDAIDPVLTRSGQLGESPEVSPSGEAGRRTIFEVHTRDIPTSAEVAPSGSGRQRPTA